MPGVLKWATQAEADHSNINTLRDCPRAFLRLDASLAASLLKIVKGGFQKEVEVNQKEEMQRHCGILNGR